MCDNTIAIQCTLNITFHRKTKHIKRHCHFVRDATKGKEIAIKYISTSKMIVDPLLKAILRYAFKAYIMNLGLHKL